MNCGALFHPTLSSRSFCRVCQRIRQNKGPGRAYNQGEYRRNRQILLKNAINCAECRGLGVPGDPLTVDHIVLEVRVLGPQSGARGVAVCVRTAHNPRPIDLRGVRRRARTRG